MRYSKGFYTKTKEVLFNKGKEMLEFESEKLYIVLE